MIKIPGLSSPQYAGRAIVVYGRSLMALEIAHSLGERGIEVIECDDVDFTVLSFSRFVKKTFTHAPHDKDPEKFIESLEKHVIKHKPKDDRPYVLIPVFRETPLIAQYAERLSKHIKVAAPAIESIGQVHPKDNLAQTAQRLGIHIPQTWLPDSEEDLKDISFPAIIKPADDVGGRGISKVKDHQELLSAYNQSKERYGTPPLVQQAVTGQDYCLAVLCDDGDIRASMAYRNIRKFPALFQDEPEPKEDYAYDHDRDEMELYWLRKAESEGLPVLGICRGAQLMNVAGGGKLHLDVSLVYKKAIYPANWFSYIFYRKKIAIQNGSLLHKILGRTIVRVNSIHKQSIAELADGLVVTAKEDNGVIQAIEKPGHNFYLGVQFHPEFLIYSKIFRRIFEQLVFEASKITHKR